MGGYFSEIGGKTKFFRRVGKEIINRTKKTKKLHILMIIILVIAARLFFSVFNENKVWAQTIRLSLKSDFEAKNQSVEKINAKIFSDKINLGNLNKEETEKDKARSVREEKLLGLLKDCPMKEMIPHILKQDEKTAAFLVGIAKKESDWGRHSPQKNGKTCYNYWGYKGGYNLTASGYSCFDNAEQAIEVVGKRVGELIKQEINTPEKMVVWKCGKTCVGHDPAGVRKWISDVDLYYRKAKI